MAKQRGTKPSELAGVGCEFCAYCFDEALLVRERAAEHEAAEEAREELDRETDFARKRAAISGRSPMPGALGG